MIGDLFLMASVSSVLSAVLGVFVPMIGDLFLISGETDDEFKPYCFRPHDWGSFFNHILMAVVVWGQSFSSP